MNKKHKVLIIEDEEFLNGLYTEIFTDAGIEVDSARDALSGLIKILSHKYDLILTNVMLPIMDGLTLVEKIKSYNLNQGPIAFLTNMGQEKVMEKGLELGAVSYILKPSYTPDEILKEVKRLLNDSVKAADATAKNGGSTRNQPSYQLYKKLRKELFKTYHSSQYRFFEFSALTNHRYTGDMDKISFIDDEKF